ncbi:hypothetical protein AGMMS50218_17040 [Actinomycetota bacterium]|nr:hypothetical protein AGMMS50218_17040 [Actinomycetota bacterium]
MSEPRVVVVGGGYGGARVAALLDDVAEVVLVEPKDAFVHASAALRAAVDASWEERVFFPYDHLLARGRVVRGHVQRATPTQVQVSDFSTLDADYLVLATGAAYPFPAKFLESETRVARARLARLREALAAAERVLVVGGGTVGLELTGELVAAYPGLQVTIVERAHDVLSTGDYLPELRTALKAELLAQGVVLELDQTLGHLPPSDVGVYEPFTVTTDAGTRIDAQVWFRCYGSGPVNDYLAGGLADLRNGLGEVAVTPTLQVPGHPTVFAVGDITDVRETKRASAAAEHAEVVAANIRSLIAGHQPTATYSPAPERVVLPLGPHGGASEVVDPDGTRRVLGAAETSAIKGADLFSTAMAELFGVTQA